MAGRRPGRGRGAGRAGPVFGFLPSETALESHPRRGHIAVLWLGGRRGRKGPTAGSHASRAFAQCAQLGGGRAMPGPCAAPPARRQSGQTCCKDKLELPRPALPRSAALCPARATPSPRPAPPGPAAPARFRMTSERQRGSEPTDGQTRPEGWGGGHGEQPSKQSTQPSPDQHGAHTAKNALRFSTKLTELTRFQVISLDFISTVNRCLRNQVGRQLSKKSDISKH